MNKSKAVSTFWMGRLLMAASLIMIGIAVASYGQFLKSNEDYIRTPGIIKEITPDKTEPALQEIKFEYTVGLNTFQITETSSRFDDFNSKVGDSIPLLVNTEDHSEVLYIQLQPKVKKICLIIGVAGLALLITTIILWRSVPSVP